MNTLGTKQEQEARRLAGGRMLLAGMKNIDVERALQVSPASIKRWKKVVFSEGIDALRAKKQPGRQPKLSEKQKEHLVQVLNEGAVAAGYSADLWTGKRVMQVIDKLFQVQYNFRYIPDLLRNLGFSLQKPQRRSRRQDSQAVKKWATVEWPRIKKGQCETEKP